MGNILCFCAFAAVNTIMLVAIFVAIYLPTPTGDEHVREAMSLATTWCIFFELFFWDTLLMPVFMAILACCN